MTNQGDNRSIRVLPFLDAYEKQENLWNPTLDSYKNKAARDEAYMNIIRELNVPSLTIHDVKLKVKSIRTTYTKELRLLTKYKEDGKDYNPKLFWFNRANSFLKNVSLSRDKKANFPEKMNMPNKDCGINYIRVEATDIQNMGDPDNNTSSTFDYKGLHTAQIESNMEEDIGEMDNGNDDVMGEKHTPQFHEEFQGQPTTTTATATTTINNPSGTETPEALANACVNACHSKCNYDEFDLFCRSVAAQLRSITDTYSRSVAKLKIQQILFEAETGHYRNNPCITIPVSQHVNNM